MTTDSITALLSDLVQIPSQGGIDDSTPIVDRLTAWLRDANLQPTIMRDGDQPAAVACTLDSGRRGPHYVLDACLDTAPTGDPGTWSRPPFSGVVHDDWLHGRGSADSKAAVVLFAHLAADFAASMDFAGRLSVLFDLDEHTGGFAGIRSFLRGAPRIDGVMIGYPGTDRIVTGGCGFLRARFVVHGTGAHTGSSRRIGTNAVVRAARLVDTLATTGPIVDLGEFGLPPKITVTGITGGTPGSYSIVPDLCEIAVDVRLTPTFAAGAATSLLRSLAAELDIAHPGPAPTSLEREPASWPAFRLHENHPLSSALLDGARSAGLDPALAVAGPSNIGCLLADHGIPATSGFGVDYVNLHAADEAIDLSTLAPVYVAYRTALRQLLRVGP